MAKRVKIQISRLPLGFFGYNIMAIYRNVTGYYFSKSNLPVHSAEPPSDAMPDGEPLRLTTNNQPFGWFLSRWTPKLAPEKMVKTTKKQKYPKHPRLPQPDEAIPASNHQPLPFLQKAHAHNGRARIPETHCFALSGRKTWVEHGQSAVREAYGKICIKYYKNW